MYVFFSTLLLSFVPFVLLGFLAVEILLRHPDNPLHQLTMMLISSLSLIFFLDFLTQVLDYDIIRVFNPQATYVFSFIAMSLLIYFFTVLSRIRFPRMLLHTAAAPPLIAILLMLLSPNMFYLGIRQGEHWRVEVHNVGFDALFLLISCYSLSYLLLIMIIGYSKLKRQHIYKREQRMMLTIMRGSSLAAAWLVFAFIVSGLAGESSIVPLDSLPTYAGLILACTLRVAMSKHQFLAVAEQRYKLLFTLSRSGIALINSLGNTIEKNPAFNQLVGISDREEINLLEIIPPQDHEHYRNILRQAFLNGMMPQDLQVPIVNRQGVSYMVEVDSDFLEIEGVMYCYLLVRDITLQQQNETRLLELAYTDSLTGLANRYQFNLRLQEALERSRTYCTRVVVMQMDLDHFKWINDTMGHSAGDLLLIDVARLIRLQSPRNSVVARMGGDEFALLVELGPGQGDAVAADIANRILHGFERQIVLKDKHYHVSCSIGMCIAPEDGQDTETLLRNADTAMYAAKRMGRNQYQMFNETLKSAAEQYLLMQQGLETAMMRDEFSLVYQPQVDSRSGAVIGAEALLRWNSAELGFVSPQDFIPIAEQSGMIRQIGEWVMMEAARQGAAWLQSGSCDKMQISVNVSASQLSDPAFSRKVAAVLQHTGLPPRLLCLEFTESAAIREEEHVMAMCDELVSMGVTLAVDDFGTGYSSMRTVTAFPFQFIKIDRSLIFDIDRNPRNEAVVRSVLELADRLDMNVLAEGVETLEHVNLLQQLGCYYIQGYYYGRPMTVEAFEQWMLNRETSIKRPS
ncbi:EAL domain-containing protein [Paenibacillus hunanensis]|uniref:putative bifunctional diguanylate cyclase/phosphodiesterase n=1 Tax=Paenibacillus hunanensis TaxID=539262 RepID=UPI002A6B3822|nr:EAL domain-containing protein [Paenibacillus hunanensis]WPP39430.1 EAL domain-containing protein [Paenibacillus hunanensis]